MYIARVHARECRSNERTNACITTVYFVYRKRNIQFQYVFYGMEIRSLAKGAVEQKKSKNKIFLLWFRISVILCVCVCVVVQAALRPNECEYVDVQKAIEAYTAYMPVFKLTHPSCNRNSEKSKNKKKTNERTNGNQQPNCDGKRIAKFRF